MAAPGRRQALFRSGHQPLKSPPRQRFGARRRAAWQCAAARIAASWHDGGRNHGETAGMASDRMTINGIELEVLRRGSGPPLVLLHGMDTVHPQAPFLDRLGRHAEIIAPSMPGFGNTKRPADFDTIYDLVHLHLALIDALPYDQVALLGLSFG